MAAEAANREEAERALRRAEEHFLAGNVAGARRLAAKARRISPSLPGAAHALAAYDVHAAAAGTQHRAGYWHDVLGVGRSASASAVKRQFRRLSLLVHPDKNRSAAAEGAFKLLGQACDALSSGSGAGHAPYYNSAASAQEWYRSHHAAKQQSTPPKPSKPPAPEAAAPPPPAESASRAGRFVRVRCERCRVAREVPGGELAAGQAKCVRCQTVLREQEQRRTYVWTSSGSYHQVPSDNPPPPPPPPTKPPTFQCPARCPQCETQFTSMVSAGTWNLRCRNCLKRVMVKVKGPEEATCT
ncbi:hypothetical protein ACQJBY_046954 [Aegilops geniculata]